MRQFLTRRKQGQWSHNPFGNIRDDELQNCVNIFALVAQVPLVEKHQDGVFVCVVARMLGFRAESAMLRNSRSALCI